MFVLLLIVGFAVLALWLSNTRPKHPAALVATGLMSVLLGGRAVAVFSDSYASGYLGAARAAETNAPGDAFASADEAATSDGHVASSGTTTPKEDAAADSASTPPRELAVEPTPAQVEDLISGVDKTIKTIF